MMTTQHTVLLLATALALAVVPAAQAHASSPRRDSAAAEVLFRAALKALDSGDWSVACIKFNASMNLYPSVGTLINVAKCHEHEGKLATAWADLNRALVLNRETEGKKRKADLEKDVRRRIAALEPRLPKLQIIVRGSPVGLEVTRDGVDASAVVGDALPVDPGTHDIEATAPGYTTDKRTVTLVEGKAVTVELSLVAMDVASPRRVAAYAAGGVGIAGLVLGGVMGGVAYSNKTGVIDVHCGPAMAHVKFCDSEEAKNTANEAKTLALVSDIGFAVGAAGMVTAVVLLITAPKRPPAALGGVGVAVVSAGREGAVFGVKGAW